MFNNFIQPRPRPTPPPRNRIKELNPKWTKGIELCNRTACQSPRGVYMWNKSTRAYYCFQCARMINSAQITNIPGAEICKEDEKKRDYEDKYKNHENTWNDYQNGLDVLFQ